MNIYTRIDDKYQRGREYTVRSIYFDTSQLKFYNEKIDGIRDRKKLRIRAYNQADDNEAVFLEIKRKVENYILKNRAPLLFSDFDKLLKNKDAEELIIPSLRNEVSISDAKKFYNCYAKLSLRPIVLVVYEREAFYSKFDNRLRITFDKNLRFLQPQTIEQLFDDENLIHVMPGYLIMEIKFTNGFPMWLQHILTDFELTRTAISKYSICIDQQKQKAPFLSNYFLGIGSGINSFSNKI